MQSVLTPHNETGRTRVWRPPWPVDLHATLGSMRRGAGDPSYQVDSSGRIWRAVRTPSGAATLCVGADAANAEVVATAWGSGASWALESVPELLGSRDRVDGFRPAHGLVGELWRRHRGWRVPRSALVLEALVPAVLEQKVTGTEAWRAWRYLLRRFGDPPPGPHDCVPRALRVPPSAQVWRAIPTWEWHRAGVDQARSSTAVRAAGVAGRLEESVSLRADEARARLEAVPGVGVWTSAEVAQRAFGDADAVSVGDLHLPALVGWALRGERVDDDGMLELLEPFRGHRYRVVRLLELWGPRPPRRGPRFAPRDYRNF